MPKYLSLLLLASAILSSCGKDTPTSSTPSVFIHAKAGSTFTFEEYSTDSTNAIITGTRDTFVSTILRTDGLIGGKSGVLVVEEKRMDSKDTMYYFYESNNNFSTLLSAASGSWFTIPVGTGTPAVTATADSSTDQGVTTIVRDSSSITLSGSENVTVKGQAIATTKVKFVLHELITVGGVNFLNASAENLIYYAPSLGFAIKTSSASRPDPAGGWIDGTYQTLIDHDLK